PGVTTDDFEPIGDDECTERLVGLVVVGGDARYGAVHPEPSSAVRTDVHAASSDDLAVLPHDVLVPSRAADQPREPGAGVESIDALDELDPLAGAGVRNPFDGQLAIPGSHGRDRERAAAADDSILSVERLEPELAKPVLILAGSAVGQRLKQE